MTKAERKLLVASVEAQATLLHSIVLGDLIGPHVLKAEAALRQALEEFKKEAGD